MIQPLAFANQPLINWRLRDIGQPQSRIVMHDMYTCANCHSFSADGKWMGLDVDGSLPRTKACMPLFAFKSR